ncbi:hypothetical protein RHGRI_027009 [Rhododendron griersonianum]|uniref:Uncharacterized protein n=1 Tax=Rhododendron griersonianum TaxID=479676 RepID=A0AAV6IYS8_9ERIC|nr:hypothetical protein RHGRI_027009 [Rhododendron griersonianum]
MTGGRSKKQRDTQKKRDAKKGASSSQAIEPQEPEPQAIEQLGADDIVQICMEAKTRFVSAIDVKDREKAKKQLEELSNLYPPFAAYAYHTLSQSLLELSKTHKTPAGQEPVLREALTWAELAINQQIPSGFEERRAYVFSQLMAVNHADALSKWAMVLPLDRPDKESYLELAEKKCKDAFVLARKTLDPDNENVKLVLEDGYACKHMLTNIKKKRKEAEVALKSLALYLDKDKDDKYKDKDDEVSTELLVEKAAVAEGVGEDELQKVEQESSSELDPLPLDPPPIEVCWRVAGIMYKLTHRFKRYDIGWTSFGEYFDKDRSTQISLVSFESLRESKSYFDILKNFKDSRIVECYVIDDKGVMIELVDSDIETWVEEEYKTFIDTNSSCTWWAHIQHSFKSIFRDILLALQFLFERGAYCGDLANNISIINGKSAKLSEVIVAQGDLRDRIWEDIDDLRHLMETVLLKGYESDLGNLNKNMNQILDEVLPYALSLFLGYLRDQVVRTEHKVYEHGLNQQLIVEKERKKHGRPYTVLSRDSIFLGVIAYSKNLVGHYNDHDPQVPLLTYDIVPIADRLFLGGCSMIRNSMAMVIFGKTQGLGRWRWPVDLSTLFCYFVFQMLLLIFMVLALLLVLHTPHISRRVLITGLKAAGLFSGASVGAAIVEAENSLETEICENKGELKTKQELLREKSDAFNYENPKEDKV